MKNFLLEALNEISDEHIAEAVTYEKKTKVSFKQIITAAACFIMMLVTAFAVTRITGDSPHINESTDVGNTYTSVIDTTAATVSAAGPTAAAPAITAAPTTAAAPELSGEAATVAGTTVANAPEYTAAPAQNTTDACVTSIPWERSPYSYIYRGFSFDGVEYTNYYGALIGEEKLSDKLGQAVLVASDDKGNRQEVNVDIFEIDGVSTDCATALYFWDGVQKQYCAQGYYVYYNKSYTPENLGQAMDEMDFKDNMLLGASDIYIYYDKTSALTAMTCKYIVNEEAKKEFNDLLKNNREVKGEAFDYDSKISDENLVMYVGYLGSELSFTLNSDGYLYFGLGDNELRYNIGKQAFNEFLKVIESECQVENSTMPALNLTTTSQVAVY